MSARPKPVEPDMLPSVEYAPEPAITTKSELKSDLKVVESAPAAATKPILPLDPLAALKTLTDEEKIALFS